MLVNFSFENNFQINFSIFFVFTTNPKHVAFSCYLCLCFHACCLIYQNIHNVFNYSNISCKFAYGHGNRICRTRFYKIQRISTSTKNRNQRLQKYFHCSLEEVGNVLTSSIMQHSSVSNILVKICFKDITIYSLNWTMLLRTQ